MDSVSHPTTNTKLYIDASCPKAPKVSFLEAPFNCLADRTIGWVNSAKSLEFRADCSVYLLESIKNAVKLPFYLITIAFSAVALGVLAFPKGLGMALRPSIDAAFGQILSLNQLLSNETLFSSGVLADPQQRLNHVQGLMTCCKSFEQYINNTTHPLNRTHMETLLGSLQQTHASLDTLRVQLAKPAQEENTLNSTVQLSSDIPEDDSKVPAETLSSSQVNSLTPKLFQSDDEKSNQTENNTSPTQKSGGQQSNTALPISGKLDQPTDAQISVHITSTSVEIFQSDEELDNSSEAEPSTDGSQESDSNDSITAKKESSPLPMNILPLSSNNVNSSSGSTTTATVENNLTTQNNLKPQKDDSKEEIEPPSSTNTTVIEPKMDQETVDQTQQKNDSKEELDSVPLTVEVKMNLDNSKDNTKPTNSPNSPNTPPRKTPTDSTSSSLSSSAKRRKTQQQKKKAMLAQQEKLTKEQEIKTN